MKKQHIVRSSKTDPGTTQTDWTKADAMSAEALDAAIEGDPDEGPDHLSIDWNTAVVGLPARKEMVNMRLDPDILAWFRAHGRGYQTRINAVLRAFVEAKTEA